MAWTELGGGLPSTAAEERQARLGDGSGGAAVQ